MDKIGCEETEQDGARFAACMWICTKTAISTRPEQLHIQITTITEAINETWDFLYGTHEWIQKSSVELH